MTQQDVARTGSGSPNRSPLAGLVFEVLRRAVVQGHFPVGTRIIEEQIARDLGVSRTPVREAIRKLEALSLVEVEPNRGAVVRGLSVEEIRQINYVRKLLEGGAVELACRHITPEQLAELERNLNEMAAAVERADTPRLAALNGEFHAVIRSAAGNRPLLHSLEALLDRISLVWDVSRPDHQRYVQTIREHQAILEQLKRRDSAAAREALLAHIAGMEATLLEKWQDRKAQAAMSLQALMHETLGRERDKPPS